MRSRRTPPPNAGLSRASPVAANIASARLVSRPAAPEAHARRPTARQSRIAAPAFTVGGDLRSARDPLARLRPDRLDADGADESRPTHSWPASRSAVAERLRRTTVAAPNPTVLGDPLGDLDVERAGGTRASCRSTLSSLLLRRRRERSAPGAASSRATERAPGRRGVAVVPPPDESRRRVSALGRRARPSSARCRVAVAVSGVAQRPRRRRRRSRRDTTTRQQRRRSTAHGSRAGPALCSCA